MYVYNSGNRLEITVAEPQVMTIVVFIFLALLFAAVVYGTA